MQDGAIETLVGVRKPQRLNVAFVKFSVRELDNGRYATEMLSEHHRIASEDNPSQVIDGLIRGHFRFVPRWSPQKRPYVVTSKPAIGIGLRRDCFTVPPLRCALEVVGIDRLLFSVDYPYSPNTRGRAFLDSLPDILGADDFAKLTHCNAEHLLSLRSAA